MNLKAKEIQDEICQGLSLKKQPKYSTCPSKQAGGDQANLRGKDGSEFEEAALI